MPDPLPIDALRDPFTAALSRGNVVVTAPTGTGKSTEVPRWIRGRVLVIEPRRVACRALASRVAELTGCELGSEVGYRVRDEDRASEATRLLFATPGIALARPKLLDDFDAVVLDELHERRMDVDLLLALCLDRGRRLVVMSATLDGDRVARHIQGKWLSAQARSHPVAIEYRGPHAELPTGRDLERRVRASVESLGDEDGDVLVFLPGKGEIAKVAAALSGVRGSVLELHGGLSLNEQARVFRPAQSRKILLATNVAETSLTVPGVTTVIDSGLVRRTRYHAGRGYLALSAVATDSADQRAGRAGRTGPGRALRLLGRSARLETATAPEVHRESVVPIVLAALFAGKPVTRLPFLDPPKDYAVEAAEQELRSLGALDESGRLTDRGRRLASLPVDPWLGRLLTEAEQRGGLEDAIDLVSALSLGQTPELDAEGEAELSEAEATCDASRLVRFVRGSKPRRAPQRALWLEAQSARARLRATFGAAGHAPSRYDREQLIDLVLRADPTSAHVARRHGRRTGFSNGGTELELGRQSAAASLERLDAILVLDVRALASERDRRLVASQTIPVSLSRLGRAGLGEERIAAVGLDRGKLSCTLERVYARRVLGTREAAPDGALARDAIATLFLRGSLFPDALAQSRENLRRRALAARLKSLPGVGELVFTEIAPPPDLETWARLRLEELGVETAEDLELLSPADLVAPDVPVELRPLLDEEYPVTVSVGDCTYEARYDLPRRQVALHVVRGDRKVPPPQSYLPAFRGLKVCVEAGGSMHWVRSVPR